MRERYRNIIAILLVVLFTGYYGGSVFLNHTHMVDGKIICHSHANGSAPHGHSTNEIAHIHFLSLLVLLGTALLTLGTPQRKLIEESFATEITIKSHRPCDHFQLRAPPIFAR